MEASTDPALVSRMRRWTAGVWVGALLLASPVVGYCVSTLMLVHMQGTEDLTLPQPGVEWKPVPQPFLYPVTVIKGAILLGVIGAGLLALSVLRLVRLSRAAGKGAGTGPWR